VNGMCAPSVYSGTEFPSFGGGLCLHDFVGRFAGHLKSTCWTKASDES